MKWQERYSCYMASVAHGALTLSVSWVSSIPSEDQGEPTGNASGFKVTVANRQLKARFADVKEAQLAAAQFALKIANEAIKELERDGT